MPTARLVPVVPADEKQQLELKPSLDSIWTPGRHSGGTEIALSL